MKHFTVKSVLLGVCASLAVAGSAAAQAYEQSQDPQQAQDPSREPATDQSMQQQQHQQGTMGSEQGMQQQQQRGTTEGMSQQQGAQASTGEFGTPQETVLFKFDSADLTPGAQEKLIQIAKWACDNKDQQITVEGHADQIGPSDYNTDLSERRATAVRTALENGGVQSSRVDLIVFGDLKPAVKAPLTIKAQQPNRRVVLYPGEQTASR
ncbi:MAG TPA: OmpA family protein [Kofleriaceae bacterium]|jgi:outer membrane protein OmpA-like peptidoglycan-associated protein|nr:OmpA family protein [Kofleriaceae bacterium]